MDKRLSRQGGYVMICPDYHGQSFLTIGPDVGKCLAAFFAVNIISTILLIILGRSNEARTYFLIHLVILIYWDLSWIACALINPGIVVQTSEDCQGDYCQKCQDREIPLKEDRVHCDRCKVCLDGQRHHCSLFGGCVAKNNQVTYYFFILGLFLWVIDLTATLPFTYYMI